MFEMTVVLTLAVSLLTLDFRALGFAGGATLALIFPVLSLCLLLIAVGVLFYLKGKSS